MYQLKDELKNTIAKKSKKENFLMTKVTINSKYSILNYSTDSVFIYFTIIVVSAKIIYW